MILRNSNDFKKSLGIQRILRNLMILTNSTEFMELSAGGADHEVVRFEIAISRDRRILRR